MSSVAIAKKHLLQHLSVILSGNDDLFPEEIIDPSLEYDRWNQARDELVDEFDRRSEIPNGK